MPIAGYNSAVTVATWTIAAQGTFTEMDGIKDFKIGDSRDLLDVSNFADATNVRARMAALRDIKVDISGDFEPADASYLKLYAAYQAGDTLAVKVYTSAVATTSGFGYALKVASIDINGSVDGKVEASFNLMIDSSATAAVFAI